MFDSMELVTIKKLAGKVTQPIDPEFLPPGYGGGGVSNYNDLLNRPLAIEKSIKWDGKLEGLTWVRETITGDNFWSYKVSDELPNREELIGGFVEEDGDTSTLNVTEITADMIVDTAWGEGYAIASGNHKYVVVVSKPIDTLVERYGVSAGVYFYHPNSSEGSTATRALRWGGIKLADASVMPYGYPSFDIYNVTPILPETTLEMQPTQEGLLYTPIHLEAGKTYCVRWCGIDYPCVANTFSMEGMTVGVVLGNRFALGNGGAETNEPFVIVSIAEDMVEAVGANTMIQALNIDINNPTFSIYPAKFNTIHSGYLPKMVVNFTKVNDEQAFNGKADRTLAQILEAYNAGYEIEGWIDIPMGTDRYFRTRLSIGMLDMGASVSSGGITFTGGYGFNFAVVAVYNDNSSETPVTISTTMMG